MVEIYSVHCLRKRMRNLSKIKTP